MKKPLALTMIAGVASVSSAATSINFEVSNDDGVTWASSVQGASGQTIYVRMRVHLTGATTLGFSGLTCQPVLSNWNANDLRGEFTFPGVQNDGTPTTETAYNGRPVRSTPATNTGRIYPFGAGGQGVANSSGLLTSFVDNGNRLRFAGSKNTTETTNVAWGVASAQGPPSIAPTDYSSSPNVVVFRYKVILGEGHTENLVASVVQISGGWVKWYLNTGGTSVLNDTDITINPGTIIIPTPAAAALLGLTGVLAAIRRRRVV
jgi:hypothetical protein